MPQPVSQYGVPDLAEEHPRFLAALVITIIVFASTLTLMLGTYYVRESVLAMLGLAALALLASFPEIALGCLMVVGSFKAAPQLENAPVDLTIVLVLVLLWSMGRALLCRTFLPLPKELGFYAPILFMMLLSLIYTPDFSVGLEKVARFFVICGVAIAAPFAVLTTPARIQRFFWMLLAAGLAASVLSLQMLGGHARLTMPGGDTIQLGHITAAGIAIVWYGLVPGRRLWIRLVLYGCIAFLAIAMIGAGSRGAIVALGAVVLTSVWYRRHIGFNTPQLLVDFAILVVMSLLLMPFVPIPQDATDYLARLTSSVSTEEFLGPRAGLLELGFRLTLENPLTGVGIGGFPTLYAGIGNWPHSIPLELGSELGLIPVFSFCGLLVCALAKAREQLFVEDAGLRTAKSLVFCLIVIVTISMLNTGNLNDNRQLWTALSLPFVLSAVGTARPANQA